MTVESPPAIKRLNHIQVLRGIAALMVVVSHLLIIEQKYSADQVLGDWASYGMAGVDLFFVISGFIMVYVMWDKPRGVKASGEFLWGRASRIYPLYWVVSLVLLALWFVRPDMVFSSIEGEPNFIKSFLLFPDTREPLLAVGWTLIHEMYFYLVFAFIVFLPRDMLAPCIVVWIVAVFLGQGVLEHTGESNAVTDIIFSPLTFEFIGGAVAACIFKLRRVGRKVTKWSTTSKFLLALGILMFIGEVFDSNAFPLQGYDRLDAFLFPCVMIVYGLAAMDHAEVTIWQPLVTLGDWSYSLYLTHVLSLTVIGRLWANFNNDSLVDNVVILIAMVAGAIFISGLVFRYIEAPMIKAARNMRGRLFKAKVPGQN